MPPLKEQLHDIEGIDIISAWPLAIGWWVVIACGLMLAACLFWLLWKQINYMRSWKRDAIIRLNDLESHLTPATSVESVMLLSEYLRRIACRRFPRKECAGLVGDAWLHWLDLHDANKFNWSEKGKLLINIPYAPANKELQVEQVKELIHATKKWVC